MNRFRLIEEVSIYLLDSNNNTGLVPNQIQVLGSLGPQIMAEY